MPQAKGDKEAQLPINGLNTEASPLNFPEGFCSDALNVEPDYDPLRIRVRKGMDDYSGTSSIGEFLNQDISASTFLWEGVGGDPDLDFVVMQCGEFLRFYNLSTGAFVTEGFDLTNTLSGTTIGTAANLRKTPPVFENVKGVLLVTHRSIDPTVIEYDSGTDGVDGYTVSIKIRDIFGVDDGLEVDERPTTLTDDHKYNLYNQGWYQQRKITSGGAFTDPIAEFNTINSEYPSNADVVWIGMVESSGDLIFDADWLKQQTFGSSPAPKGHYIVDAFNIDRDAILTSPQQSGNETPGYTNPADEWPSNGGYIP